LSEELDQHVGVIDLAILRLETLSFRAQKFIDMNMMNFAIREILDPMKNLALARGVAQSFIDSMSIVKLDFMKVGFQINYDRKTATGIPVNKLVEFGWNEFDITSSYPNGPMLHWTGGRFGPGNHFAYSTHHPGFQGYHMLQSLENWGFIEIFAIKLIHATSEYLEATAFK
jgi:hypothetical protein